MKRINITKEQRAELLISAKILDEEGNYHKDFFSKETVEKNKSNKLQQENTMDKDVTLPVRPARDIDD